MCPASGAPRRCYPAEGGSEPASNSPVRTSTHLYAWQCRCCGRRSRHEHGARGTGQITRRKHSDVRGRTHRCTSSSGLHTGCTYQLICHAARLATTRQAPPQQAAMRSTSSHARCDSDLHLAAQPAVSAPPLPPASTPLSRTASAHPASCMHILPPQLSPDPRCPSMRPDAAHHPGTAALYRTDTLAPPAHTAKCGGPARRRQLRRVHASRYRPTPRGVRQRSGARHKRRGGYCCARSIATRICFITLSGALSALRPTTLPE